MSLGLVTIELILPLLQPWGITFVYMSLDRVTTHSGLNHAIFHSQLNVHS